MYINFGEYFMVIDALKYGTISLVFWYSKIKPVV